MIPIMHQRITKMDLVLGGCFVLGRKPPGLFGSLERLTGVLKAVVFAYQKFPHDSLEALNVLKVFAPGKI